MPELPEVETVVRGLRRIILGCTFTSIDVKAPQSSIVLSQAFKGSSFAEVLEGRSVLDVTRRGKNILMSVSGDITLWVHLKMTGRFLHTPDHRPRDKHDLVIFRLNRSIKKKNESLEIRFNDYRRFGRLRVFPSRELWQQPGLKELGPEPLDLTAEGFVMLCRRRSRMIKAALLDQSFLAGIGNIYADESLFAARIHPSRLSSSISERKLLNLHHHIQRLLKSAIDKMGTSVDTYAGVNGQPGEFQAYLQVYGRENQPCVLCGTKIVREKLGARSAHFCPRCQRA